MHDRDTVSSGTPLPAADSTDDSASAHKLLNTTLIGILAQPESVEPYVEMLAGIQGMVAAHAGAIYHFPAGAAQAAPIASTGDMVEHTATIQEFADSLQQPAPMPSLWFDGKEAPDLFIKAIWIGGDIEQEFALLVLICDDAYALRASRGEFFETLAEGFAGIFRATRQAQVNRRRALQKETCNHFQGTA